MTNIRTALYTVTYSGAFYRGPALSIGEIITRAADMGFKGVEIGAKRPVASPLDLDAQRRQEVRTASARSGIEIGGVASYTNFATPILEHREAELMMLRETIRLAHDLEAPVVRVIAGWLGTTVRDGQLYYEARKGYSINGDVTSFEQWHWVRQCLEEAARWCEQYGVVGALQNHKPVLNTHQDTLDMIREVDSPWIKACIDAPHLADQSDEAVRQALLETGALEVWSHFGGYVETPDHKIYEDTGEGEIPVNYPAFFRGLREIGYEGFVSYEGCGPALVHHEYHGIEEVDRRVRIAHEYMQRQIAGLDG